MTQELEQKIFDDFPKLFNPDPELQKNLMSFGFECDDGWFNLIYNLCKEVYPLVLELNKNEDSLFQVFQVKEKYGTLRFYVDFGDEKIQEIISLYEAKSEQICECCGKYGKLRARGHWLKTLCWLHKIEFGYKNL